MTMTGSITGFLLYIIGSGFKMDFDIDNPVAPTGLNGINEEIMLGLPKW